MKLRFNIQTKLLTGFILILLVTVILVAVTGRIWFHHEIQQFFEQNGIVQQPPFPLPENAPVMGGFETIFLMFTVFGAVLATIMSFIFARYLVKPIESVIATTQEIAKGKYQARIETKRKDEVGNLCLAVNEMASKLEKTEQLRRELVSNVAHELATPLTNIGGYLHAINDGTIEQGESMKETLILLEKETDRLSSMVDDVRALYTVDNPKKKLDLKEMNLEQLIKDVVRQMKPNLDAKSLELKVHIRGKLNRVKADHDKLVQVLMNLLANAIAYTPQKGEIEVSASEDEQNIHLSVKDTGIGISEEDLPFIFERFYRVDKSRSRKTGGTGVGLTIVKDLIEAHGGKVEVKSTLGTGTEFICTLPR